MANTGSCLPLYDRIARRSIIHRALDTIVLFLLVSVLIYRLISLKTYGFVWVLALLCESWFTFIWILTISTKWTPVEYTTYPERLSERVKDLPPVDMFVTTADPALEPPKITVNTVISLLALDYPTDKLACYVSDDACSPLIYYSLVEGSKFAKKWVPFCKKYGIQDRAPFKYFANKSLPYGSNSVEFQQEHQRMKDAYEELCLKIEVEARKKSMDLTGDLAVFSDVHPKNHPTIIKVILENKEELSDGLPTLIYVSREKRQNHPHNYKAGAMNVLTRVSGMITNAPFTLNVDCDVFANNPQIIRHAMCLLLGSKSQRESGFVQSPHYFYDGLKDDPFGNQMVVLEECTARGTAGIQGPFYGGSECFHRRKVIYGLCPEAIGDKARNLTPVHGDLEDKKLLKIFGNSREFIKKASIILQGKMTSRPTNISDLVEAAREVASCIYESGTCWGKEIGWLYGSQTEDVLTGMIMHKRGWKSLQCAPDPKGFLGSAPIGGPASMTQQKRWAMGLLEILVSKKSVIFATFTGELQLRQCLAYMCFQIWALRSVPELCYLSLPAYCILAGSNFLPKEAEPAFYIFVALLMIYNFYTLLEYLQIGLSIRAWWNNQRMRRITSGSAWLFGILSVLLKLLGRSDTVFDITLKEESPSIDNGDAGRFTFDRSPIFVPGTTLLLVHLTALAMGLLRLLPSLNGGIGRPGLGEMVCCLLVVISFWPYLKGLFEKGKYGIPLSTIFKAALLASFFVHLCKRT